MAGNAEIDKLLSLVQDCLAKHLYTSAAFFANKLVVLSGDNPCHVYLLAQVGVWGSVCLHVFVCERVSE